MAIVTGLMKRVEIPNEEGQWLKIRQLSWRQREKASDARTDAVLNRVKGMGAELIKQLQGAETRPEVEGALADPSVNYDKLLVLQYGIAEWSYPEKLTVGVKGKLAFSDAIENLDDATADWAMREILAFSSPPPEEQQKNG